jgi:hexulose-6-phosphate isomerase
MKKGLCWGVLPPELSFEQRFALAADAGFAGIEPVVEAEGGEGLIRYDSTDAQLKQALRMASDKGLTFCSLMGGGVHVRQHPIVDDDPAERQKGMDAIRRLFEIAATLEAEVLLLVPHWVPEKVRYDYCYQRTLAALQKLGPDAEAHGVVIGLENVWNKFLVDPFAMRAFIDQFNSEWLGAYFDVGNAMLVGYPEQWIRILGKRIKRVHFKDFRRGVGTADGFVDLLAGDVNWPEVMTALRDVGYSGPLTAEMIPAYKHCAEVLIGNTSRAMDAILSL